jgi:hypothetical protein
VADELKKLQHNARRRAELLEERDDLIFDARAAGVPVTHIAEAAGLSAMHVHRLLREAWLVAEVETGKPISWHRSEEAARNMAATNGNWYFGRRIRNEDGSWDVP